MTDKTSKFDDQIRSSIQGLETNYNPEHWERMNSDLDKLELEDAQFDKITAEKLNNIQHPTLNNSHWESMAHRINQEFSWKQYILRYKAVELSLMSLILFTTSNLIVHPFSNTKNTDYAAKQGKINYIKSDFNKGGQESAATKNITVPSVKNQKTVSVTATSKSNGVANEYTKAILGSSSNSISNISMEANATSVSNDVAIFNIKSDQGIANYPLNDNNYQLPTTNYQNEPLISAAHSQTSLLTELSPSLAMVGGPSVVDNPTFPTRNNYQLPTIKDKLPTSGTYLGVNVSTNYDITNTQYRNAELSLSTHELKKSIGMGISLGYRLGDIEISTGAQYSTRKYTSAKAEIEHKADRLNNILSESANQIQVNLIQVPLLLQYHALHFSKLDIFAAAGLGFNMSAMTNDYPKTTSINTPTQQPFSEVWNSGLVLKPEDQPTYNKGFLQNGGSLKDNFFLTANFAIGLEYKLNQKYNLFIQPSYNAIIAGGIGPYADQLSTLSLSLGTKIRL
jgi:hypothetical protein